MPPTKHHPIKRYTGFTLVELLTVISIIGVLLAVLMPALAKTREIARRMRCCANLRQIALAWNLYLDDHNGQFYQGINTNLSYGGWKGIKGWHPRPLNPYLSLPLDINDASQAKIFQCPADQGGMPGAFFREKVFDVCGTSFQTNIFLVGQNRCGKFSDQTAPLDTAISDRLPSLNENRVNNPTRLLLMGDYGWINQWKPKPHPQPEWKTQTEWHGKEDLYNMAFLDGHVESIKMQKGIYVTETYTVVPFEDLYGLAREVQGPEGE